MKIAYVSTYDAQDKSQWSGLGYYMFKCLADQGVEVIMVNCSVPVGKLAKLKTKILKIVFGKVYQVDRDPSFLRRLATVTTEKLAKEDFDVVFCPGSLPITYLDIKKPMVFWTDSTYDGLVDFYPAWKNIAKQSLKHGQEAEQLAIDKASLIFYTSDWAKNNALSVYKADPQKVKIVPFGANLDGRLAEADIEKLIYKRAASKQVNFLFVGVEWERKGGVEAVATVEKLRAKGVEATLTIIGCPVPGEYKGLPFIESVPFISKNTQAGIDALNNYYENASFFLLPTHAECFGVVFAEASSYGLPVITSNVGGCPSAVVSGYNGFCLSLSNFPESAVEKIMPLVSSKENYQEYSFNSYKHFRDSLNWTVIGENVVNEIKTMLQKKTASLQKSK